MASGSKTTRKKLRSSSEGSSASSAHADDPVVLLVAERMAVLEEIYRDEYDAIFLDTGACSMLLYHEL
eukprot:52974-Eustigmatos_ZCMA.PRE.1